MNNYCRPGRLLGSFPTAQALYRCNQKNQWAASVNWCIQYFRNISSSFLPRCFSKKIWIDKNTGLNWKKMA